METAKITPQMWLDWQRSPATAAIVQYLETQKTALIEQLLSLPLENTAEQLGIQFIALRYKLDGLGEFLDFDALEEALVKPVEGEANED
jgi:hypothetical protein